MVANGARAITRRTGAASSTTRTSGTRRISGALTITKAPRACTTAIRPRCEFRSTTRTGTTSTRNRAATTRGIISFWIRSRRKYSSSGPPRRFVETARRDACGQTGEGWPCFRARGSWSDGVRPSLLFQAGDRARNAAAAIAGQLRDKRTSAILRDWTILDDPGPCLPPALVTGVTRSDKE